MSDRRQTVVDRMREDYAFAVKDLYEGSRAHRATPAKTALHNVSFGIEIAVGEEAPYKLRQTRLASAVLRRRFEEGLPNREDAVQSLNGIGRLLAKAGFEKPVQKQLHELQRDHLLEIVSTEITPEEISSVVDTDQEQQRRAAYN